jgi:hypothetical protein
MLLHARPSVAAPFEGAEAVRHGVALSRSLSLCALLASVLGCDAAPSAPGASTSETIAATTSAAVVGSGDASATAPVAVDAGVAQVVALTNFDGPPAATIRWAGKKLRWAKAKLEVRAVEGWESELVKGYPVIRTPDRQAFLALFGDVGALPPRTHLDMRLGWFEAGRVDWALSRNGKLGEGHLPTEQTEGPGKIGVTKDGVTKVHTARFWALYVELPGRPDGLLVLAAATDAAKDRIPEMVAMVQSLAVS